MSYQQTTQTETNFPARSATTMYSVPQSRTHYDSQGQIPNNENLPMSALMSQFAGLSIPGANAAGGASSQFYVTADGQFFCAPVPTVYPSQPMTELAGNTYNYPALPYIPQAAYPHGYLSGYPMMPYTPGRTGYYPDSRDHLHKEVPGLENRRGSYSTNESTPGTPYYGASLRDHGAQIAAVDRSPFGSTPSPREIPAHIQPATKPLPYKSIPVDVDIDALLVKDPAIPRAVPAVFTPRESMRTLDQSLSNPIYGNRNVYIRGLHPNTDDDTLAAFAARFGNVETSKAIIDTSTGACKG
jgi:hypothetical protein